MNSFQIVTHNVNYDPRAEKDFSIFAWKNRKEKLLAYYTELIQKDIPTIFCLQEVMPEYMGDILDTFKEYHCHTQKVHPNGRQIITLVPEKYTSKRIEVRRPSEKHRQVFLVTSIMIKEKKIILYNTHFPMGLEWRHDFTDELVNLLDKFTDIPNVVVGDFNTFPDEWGIEQSLQIQLKGNVVDVTQYMEDVETKKRVLKTFSPYPYDKVPINIEPYNLDHIYVRKICTERVQVHFLKQLEWNDVMYSLSDHAMLSIKLLL